jgi:hypothetical protein
VRDEKYENSVWQFCGDSKEDAAKETWSYRRANDKGFSEVRDLKTDPYPYADPDEINKVTLKFTKPIQP